MRGASSKQTFFWSSMNASLVTVTQNGVAKTLGLSPGEVEVMASMNRASHNQGRAKILIMPAVAMDIVNSVGLEAQVGAQLRIPLAFYGAAKPQMPFTKCNHLPYK